MTPFQKIIQSVAPIKAYADHNPKWETEKEYVVFNISDDRGAAYGDDNPTENVTAFQIHWYFPQGKNYLNTMRSIRKRLMENGFTCPTIQPLYEKDTNSHHIIFECEIELEA
jgi:hypothetical protein